MMQQVKQQKVALQGREARHVAPRAAVSGTAGRVSQPIARRTGRKPGLQVSAVMTPQKPSASVRFRRDDYLKQLCRHNCAWGFWQGKGLLANCQTCTGGMKSPDWCGAFELVCKCKLATVWR